MHCHVSFPKQQLVSKYSITMSDHYCLKSGYGFKVPIIIQFHLLLLFDIHSLLGSVFFVRSICSGIPFVQTPGCLLQSFVVLFLSPSSCFSTLDRSLWELSPFFSLGLPLLPTV